MARCIVTAIVLLLAFPPPITPAIGAEPAAGPYGRQVREQLVRLEGESPAARARAAESLGFLRAYAAEAALAERLRDDRSPEVRRNAALALAWCGGRGAVPPLLAALDDRDWLTAQAAHVALTNLTGMEFPFDAAAPAPERAVQARGWREWWAAVPPDRPPDDVLKLLGGEEVLAARAVASDAPAPNPALGRRVTASTTYKGPPSVLTDGYVGPEYWQTKFVDPPQWCTLDLGRPTDVHRVIVHQYSEAFVMTGYEVAVSLDGKSFEPVERRRPEPRHPGGRFPRAQGPLRAHHQLWCEKPHLPHDVLRDRDQPADGRGARAGTAQGIVAGRA